MGRDAEGLELWNVLRGRWQEANQSARFARAAVTLAYSNCLAGRGRAPAMAQIDEAQRLEHLADMLSIELDNLARALLA